MADEVFAKAGFHFDELNKIRILEPDVAQQTTELKDDCKDFIEKSEEFQTIVTSFINLIDTVGTAVEKEKMKAIGARNLLKSIAKQRESEQLQLQALIQEKKMQLERLRMQYEALQKEEAEQNEFIEQFILQK